jgi:hypothetical protein
MQKERERVKRDMLTHLYVRHLAVVPRAFDRTIFNDSFTSCLFLFLFLFFFRQKNFKKTNERRGDLNPMGASFDILE